MRSRLMLVMVGAVARLGVAEGVHGARKRKGTAAKLKAAGKKASCKLGAQSKADAKAATPDTAKLAKCSATFSSAFTKAEAKADCLAGTGDTSAIEAKIDSLWTT